MVSNIIVLDTYKGVYHVKNYLTLEFQTPFKVFDIELSNTS